MSSRALLYTVVPLLILGFVAIFGSWYASAAPVAVQTTADQVEDAEASILHFTPAHRPVSEGSLWEMATCSGVARDFTCAGLAWDTQIHLRHDIMVGVYSAANPYPRRWANPAAMQVLIHEELHQVGRPADGIGEGIVDAVAWDLMPAVTHRVFGEAMRPGPPAYSKEVHSVRKASAIATGSSSWRTSAARLKRRDWWWADDATRHAEIEAALAS